VVLVLWFGILLMVWSLCEWFVDSSDLWCLENVVRAASRVLQDGRVSGLAVVSMYCNMVSQGCTKWP
jgi:hypothetical protein